jgi:NitT/TauT family transport system ATP-binding protein
VIHIEGLRVEYTEAKNVSRFVNTHKSNKRFLSLRYKGQNKSIIALENFNLNLDKGDICALIGPSGCGKSTLLYVLSGIIKDYKGKVYINQCPPNAKKHRIGYIPQNYGLLDWYSVYDNVVLGLEIKKIPFNKESILYDKNKANKNNEAIKKSDSQKSDISQILTRLGIIDIRDRYPSQLSGGQRQKVSIARSFVLNPEILLMDEPFSALDAITREEAQDMFLDLWRENNISTIFVTHSIEEAVYLGKRIGIMSPSPGHIIKTLSNPLFGRKNLRLSREYYEFCLEIRRYAKEAWSIC